MSLMTYGWVMLMTKETALVAWLLKTIYSFYVFFLFRKNWKLERLRIHMDFLNVTLQIYGEQYGCRLYMYFLATLLLKPCPLVIVNISYNLYQFLLQGIWSVWGYERYVPVCSLAGW